MDLGLAGKVAFVSGSWRGTGAGIARVLAREGASVVVHGLEPGQAEPVAAEIRAQGLRAVAVDGDVRNDAGAERAARAAQLAAGPIDVLVNNFGLGEGRGWLDATTDDWVDIYQKNTLSGVRLVQQLVPGMKQRGWGRVLFISTVGHVRPRAEMPGYYASKAALVNMTVSLARELAGTGITVNCVSPGMIATAEVRASLERRARREGWGERWEEIQRAAADGGFMKTPVGRIGTVEEVGALVAFLCSAHAGYIHGADLRIDGGAADCV
jgi:NAD(P)-dependent dehydrogenase (short-subunit alcohol dehydrogenase family)